MFSTPTSLNFRLTNKVTMINTAIQTQMKHKKLIPLITNREKHILQLVSLGKSSMEIARELFISFETVKSHRKNMRRKLDACNGASLVRAAYDNQILPIIIEI